MCALSIGLAFLCHLSIVTGITKGGYCEGFHKGGKCLLIYIRGYWGGDVVGVLADPVQPCLGHLLDASAVFRRHGAGTGDGVEGDEPVIGLLGESLEQPGRGRLTHLDDALVGRVFGHLLNVGATRAVLLPFVGKPNEGFLVGHFSSPVVFGSQGERGWGGSPEHVALLRPYRSGREGCAGSVLLCYT